MDMPDAVLFACTHNSVRSPMGEGLLKHLLGHKIYVDSTGVRPQEIDHCVGEVMDGPVDRGERSLGRHAPEGFPGRLDHAQVPVRDLPHDHGSRRVGRTDA